MIINIKETAMKYLRAFLILLFVFTSLHAYPGKIVKAFKTPGGFSTGITFDGHYLWLADYQTDSLYQMDPATGKIVHKIPSPGYWPMGLAWDGKYLWNVDKMQKNAEETSRRLLTGEIEDVHQVMVAMEEAQTSFQLMMERQFIMP